MVLELVCGIDEVGRGAWAGPVVAASCVLLEGDWPQGMTESKRASPRRRAEWNSLLVSGRRVAFGIGIVPSEEIDRIGIHAANLKSMFLAYQNMCVECEQALVDGLHLPDLPIPARAIARGDAKHSQIAAASILAKEYRDRLMRDYHADWPMYGWDSNVGYGTSKHHQALDSFGPCPLHRLSYAPCRRAKKEIEKSYPTKDTPCNRMGNSLGGRLCPLD